MDAQNKGLEELIRLREIVEWQIRIAKDSEIIRKREAELKTLNAQIEKLKQHAEFIKNNAL